MAEMFVGKKSMKLKRNSNMGLHMNFPICSEEGNMK